jgi:hypothetical protein
LTRHARLEISQLTPATGDRRFGGGQEHSELPLRRQVALKLQHQPPAGGPIRHS